MSAVTRAATFVCVSVILAAAAPAGSNAATARPLITAVVDTAVLTTDADQALALIRSTGATAVRIPVYWHAVAPLRPLDSSNPGDPRYRWDEIDRSVRLALQRGLQPILNLDNAPKWAEGPGSGLPGTVRPDPVEFGRFARAAAARYSGTYGGLPRVRYWQAWNEPNITAFLTPQYVNGRPFSPGWYRRMVNEFAAGVKAAHAGNLVVAGGTSPFSDPNDELRKINPRWGPLAFMRELLCLTRSLQPKCKQRVHFDIWAHHPYTSGGPTHKAVLPDDVSLGDLPEMRRVLQAGVKAGTIVSSRPVDFWVTEFSWDSKPPDPKGVPIGLHARWVAEALYRMWSSGISLVTWYLLRDEPSTSPWQSGLFFESDSLTTARPKPAFTAFRFPLVGFPSRKGFFIWGRTPAGTPTRVVIEQSFKGGWRHLGVFRTNRYGIFQRSFSRPAVGSVRARIVGTSERARPFGLRPVPDQFFNPFGSP